MTARLDGCGMEKEKDDQKEVENGHTKRGEDRRSVSRKSVVRHFKDEGEMAVDDDGPIMDENRRGC